MARKLRVNFRKFKRGVRRVGTVRTIKFLLEAGKDAKRVEVIFPQGEEDFYHKVIKDLGLKPVYAVSISAGIYVDVPDELREVYDYISENFGYEVADSFILSKKLSFTNAKDLEELAVGKSILWVLDDRAVRLMVKGLEVYSVSMYPQPIQIENIYLIHDRETLLPVDFTEIRRGTLYNFVESSGIIRMAKGLLPKEAKLVFEVQATLIEAPISQPYY